MSGRDKPLIPWRGKPMLDHILSRIPKEMPVFISANRNLTEYAKRGTVITDQEVAVDDDTPRGPLVGVLAGLTNSQTEWLLVTPGDSPNLPSDWWQIMFDASNSKNNVVAHDGTRQQHLHLLLHETARASLVEYLNTGQHEVYRWLERIDIRQALFDEPSGFTNVNQSQDLR
jgi:molybdopterin-guanine dinucleotide biosynthesis protein A